MSHEPPFVSPDGKDSPRQPQAALRLWTLRSGNGGRTMTCEIRTDSVPGGGFECRLFEGRALMMARQFPTEAGARSMADEYREDLEREGWITESP